MRTPYLYDFFLMGRPLGFLSIKCYICRICLHPFHYSYTSDLLLIYLTFKLWENVLLNLLTLDWGRKAVVRRRESEGCQHEQKLPLDLQPELAFRYCYNLWQRASVISCSAYLWLGPFSDIFFQSSPFSSQTSLPMTLSVF